jgi:hypothetical protein
MVTDVVCDVTALEEGRLDNVDDVVHGPLQSCGDDEHEKLDITI